MTNKKGGDNMPAEFETFLFMVAVAAIWQTVKIVILNW